MGDIDFDPLTQEGIENINETVDDEYESLIPQDDETSDSYFSRLKQTFGKGYKYAISRINNIHIRKEGTNIPEYMELKDMEKEENDKTMAGIIVNEIKKIYPEFQYDGNFSKLLQYFKYTKNGVEIYWPTNKVWKPLTSNDDKLPQFVKKSLGWSKEHINMYNKSKSKLDSWFPKNKISRENGYDIKEENDQIFIKYSIINKWKPLHTKAGIFYTESFKGAVSRLPKQTIKDLGECEFDRRSDAEDALKKTKETLEKVIIDEEKLEKEYIENKEQTERLKEQIENIDDHDDKTIDLQSTHEKILEGQKKDDELFRRLENLKVYRGELENKIEENENIIDEVNEKLPLRERIKEIIKKYGVTVTGIIIAVSTIIGVIVNNLKSGLTSVSKGVGNGLKEIGKKLGQILPGMVGAIASFIFRTAGEVVGFLGRNAWLLIVAVVMIVIERYKNKK